MPSVLQRWAAIVHAYKNDQPTTTLPESGRYVFLESDGGIIIDRGNASQMSRKDVEHLTKWHAACLKEDSGGQD